MEACMHNEQSVTVATPPTSLSAPVVRWGALFAGAFVAVGVWGLLHMLGMSSGLISVDPEEASSLRSAGIGTGVWSLIAPIIALFVGGLATGRLAGPLSKLTGAIYGAVMWSLATIASLLILSTTVGAVVGGAVSVGGQVASAAASAGARALGETSLTELGFSEQDLLMPVNQRLEAMGKPPITAENLNNAVRDALRTSIRQGEIDRQVFTDALAANTALSQNDAAALAATVEQRVQMRADQVRMIGQTAQREALEAMEGTGKALLGLFFSLLLALIAAVSGSTLAVRHEQKRRLREPPRTTYGHEVIAPAE